MEVVTLVIRTAVLYIVALIVFRLMGKRTLAKMGPFDFAVIIMIGEAVAIGMEDVKTPLVNAIAITVALGVFQFILTWLNVRFRWLEKITQGASTPLITNGQINETTLRKERVSKADLFAELRKKDTKVSDVKKAKIEPTGDISIQKNQKSPSNSQPPNKTDPNS